MTHIVFHKIASHRQQRTAQQIRLLAEFGVAPLRFLVVLKRGGHLVRTLGSLAPATGRGLVGLTAGL